MFQILGQIPCPPATVDDKVNRTNRQKAIDRSFYGPEKAGDKDFWKKIARTMGVSIPTAQERRCANCRAFDTSMPRCIATNRRTDPEAGIGIVGYCIGQQFKASSEKVCLRWAPQ